MDLNKAIKIQKRIFLGWLIVAISFLILMVGWYMYYEQYLNQPNIEKALGISLPANTKVEFRRYKDIEIEANFGDVTVADITIDDIYVSNSLTKHAIDQSWELIDNGQYGKYYHIEYTIPDVVIQLGEYCGNWYPDENLLHFSCSVVSEKPFDIFIIGFGFILAAGYILLISWITIKTVIYIKKRYR